jgi:hypothetical protein
MAASSELRIHNVIAILSVSPSFKEREIKARFANLPQFQSLNCKFQAYPAIRNVKRRLSEITRVCEIFADKPFAFPCDFSLLESISNCHIQDPILNELFVLTTLHSYIAFMIKYEAINIHDGLAQLLLALWSNLNSAPNLHEIMVSALTDILTVIGQVWTTVPFDSLFSVVCDYFQSDRVPESHYIFLPQFLQNLINADGYITAGGSAKVSGLIEILLQQHRPFSQDAIDYLCSVIHPFNYQLNHHALAVFKALKSRLKPEILSSFFGDLPVLVSAFIEKSGPYLEVPPVVEIETFEPAAGPENFFRFASVETFRGGCQLDVPPALPEPDQNLLCIPALLNLIDIFIKIFGSDVGLFEHFLTHFIEYLNDRRQSAFYFDYMALMVRIWVEFTTRNQVRELPVPQAIFDPAYSSFTANTNRRFFSLRFYAMRSLLNMPGTAIDRILSGCVKYPLLFAEMVEICIMQVKLFQKFVTKRLVRAFRLMGLQLQYQEFNSPNGSTTIEQTRLSLLRLLAILLRDPALMPLFFGDQVFLPFFMSLLFEKNIRPFVLENLEKYMTQKVAGDIFCEVVMKIVEYVTFSFHDDSIRESSLLLQRDLLRTINKLRLYQTLVPVCANFPNQLPLFSDSKAARELLFEIVQFFIGVTPICGLSHDNLAGLEIALGKFETLEVEEHRHLLSLVAGEMLQDFAPKFQIQNGAVMNVLFRLFQKDSQLNIVSFANDLCDRHSNCFALHQCGFDVELLNYVLAHRDVEDPAIFQILLAVSTITCVVSSPVVVQQYISLFVPVERRFISENHHLLVQSLQLMLTRAREWPASTVSLAKTITQPIGILKTGFTFVCWVFFESGDSVTPIMSLCEETNEIISLSTIGSHFAINDQTTLISAVRKHWTFVAFTYQKDLLALYVDAHLSYSSKFRLPNPGASFSVKIAGASLSNGRLGNFGVCQPLEPEQVASLFGAGLRSVRQLPNAMFYYTADNLSTLVDYSQTAEVRPFADILLRLFKTEVLIPLFAQLDLPLKSGNKVQFQICDVLSVLAAALHVGEHEQRDFCDARGFAIISHLLLSASPAQMNLETYNTFCEICHRLLWESLQKELLHQILLNIELWIVCTNHDHIEILMHWKAVIFPRYTEFFLDTFSFTALLDRMKMYYWYENVESAVIRGEPGSPRPRHPSLNIKGCRVEVNDLLYMISGTRFTYDDVAALVDHCCTSADRQQQLDLLKLLNRIAWNRKVLGDRVDIFRSIHRFFLDDAEALFSVMYAIVGFHQMSNPELSLTEHLQVVLQKYLKDRISLNVYEVACSLLPEHPSLFHFCAYMAARLGVVTLYFGKMRPNAQCVVGPHWAVNSVLSAVQRDASDRDSIFRFLCQCSCEEWLQLYWTIQLCCRVTHSDVEEITNRFLTIVAQEILNSTAPIGHVLPAFFEVAKSISSSEPTGGCPRH